MSLEFFRVDHTSGKISSRISWEATKIVYRCFKCNVFFEKYHQLNLHKQNVHHSQSQSLLNVKLEVIDITSENSDEESEFKVEKVEKNNPKSVEEIEVITLDESLDIRNMHEPERSDVPSDSVPPSSTNAGVIDHGSITNSEKAARILMRPLRKRGRPKKNMCPCWGAREKIHKRKKLGTASRYTKKKHSSNPNRALRSSSYPRFLKDLIPEPEAKNENQLMNEDSTTAHPFNSKSVSSCTCNLCTPCNGNIPRMRRNL